MDGVYIPDEPATLMMTGQFNQVPVMVGTLRNELALETAGRSVVVKTLGNEWFWSPPVGDGDVDSDNEGSKEWL